MKNIYSFYAVFDEEEKGYNIWFPGLEGCFSCAHDINEVASTAQEVLELYLYGLLEDGIDIPEPLHLNQIEVGKGETTLLVTVNLKLVVEQMENQKIKKNLTIPAWLNTMAEKENINFSQTLQEALKEKLNVG
ncbi:MAG: type II toxin-antitoxin system HicB family antitoxin [Clostridiaceae bacterium]|nr:type II toxin-antitoxin system HicB family antitoxin [Clostridiaceae bacterium]